MVQKSSNKDARRRGRERECLSTKFKRGGVKGYQRETERDRKRERERKRD